MRLIERLEKSRSFWFLLILSVIFFMLRLPSLFEPYWYGDEGIYQAIGMVLRDGGTIYKDAFDNKPPLLYVIYAIFNSEQYLIRALSLVFGLLSIWVFFRLSKELFQKRKDWVIYFITGGFAILFGLPLIEGNIANAENFMLLPIISSAVLVLVSLRHTSEDRRNITLFLAGGAIGLAFLIKIVAIFDLAAFFVFLAVINFKKFGEFKFKRIYFLLVGFSLPVFITSLYFLITSNFRNFMNASLFSNISYVGKDNSIFFTQDLLIAKAILLLFFAYVILKKIKLLSTTSIFVLVWLGFSFFNAFFSQRPYIHYLLVILPSFCLFVGLMIREKKLQKILTVSFVFLLVFLLSSFPLYYKTIAYYFNFIDFLKGGKSSIQYISFFDKRAVTDYKIANYMNSKTGEEDSIYLWGNNAQVYKMTGKIPPHRYTVLYHVTSYKDGFPLTISSLNSKKPKFIVIMQDKDLLPISLYDYRLTMEIENAQIYERVN